jgi:hypothetical protein
MDFTNTNQQYYDIQNRVRQVLRSNPNIVNTIKSVVGTPAYQTLSEQDRRDIQTALTFAPEFFETPKYEPPPRNKSQLETEQKKYQKKQIQANLAGVDTQAIEAEKEKRGFWQNLFAVLQTPNRVVAAMSDNAAQGLLSPYEDMSKNQFKDMVDNRKPAETFKQVIRGYGLPTSKEEAGNLLDAFLNRGEYQDKYFADVLKNIANAKLTKEKAPEFRRVMTTPIDELIPEEFWERADDKDYEGFNWQRGLAGFLPRDEGGTKLNRLLGKLTPTISDAAGFAMDIGLDPMTYVGFGTVKPLLGKAGTAIKATKGFQKAAATTAGKNIGKITKNVGEIVDIVKRGLSFKKDPLIDISRKIQREEIYNMQGFMDELQKYIGKVPGLTQETL